MKLEVNKDLCLGCGACQGIAQEIFEIGDDGHAFVKVEEVPEEFNEDAMEAMDGCPTGAIEEVTEDEIKEAA